MSEIEITLAALREAVRLAPGNVDLAVHLGNTLLRASRGAEAEEQFRDTLARHPNAVTAKLGLAQAYFVQKKRSHALAIVETLIAGRNPEPDALVLHARIMFQSGDVPAAVHSYKQAIELSPESWNDDLARMLGVQAASHDGFSSDEPFDSDDEDDGDDIVDGRMRMHADAPDAEAELPELERPSMTFEDVGGMDSVKQQINLKIILPIQHPDMFAAYGKKAGGGILMYGPPGCGKTHLARATAGQVSAKFMSVGINDILDMWIGNSERNLHGIFEQARRNRPCVLFFDEVDALGASRADMRHSGARHLVNQFLSEFDGVDQKNDDVLILGATNAPWHIDDAFRRPGRFDQVIFVPPPDQEAREQIFGILLKGRPHQDVDVQKLAAKTHDYSGADLKAVVERAIDAKLQEALKKGGLSPLTTKDLLAAIKLVRPSTKEWFATARNHALYANEGGTYDDVLTYLRLK